MDHIVYVDAKAGELEQLLAGTKTMLVRGAAGRKLPHGRVAAGDRLYFVRNNGEGLVRACGRVCAAFSSDQLSPGESEQLLAANQAKHCLTPAQVSRWAGKRYLVLVEVEAVAPVDPFGFDRRSFSNMDDWLPVGEIDLVKEAQ